MKKVDKWFVDGNEKYCAWYEHASDEERGSNSLGKLLFAMCFIIVLGIMVNK